MISPENACSGGSARIGAAAGSEEGNARKKKASNARSRSRYSAPILNCEPFGSSTPIGRLQSA